MPKTSKNWFASRAQPWPTTITTTIHEKTERLTLPSSLLKHP